MNTVGEILQNLLPPEIAEAVRTGAYPQLGYEEVEQLRVDAYNATVGKAEGFDCPECQNREYIAVTRSGRFSLAPCKCRATRRSLRNIEKSGMADMLETRTFKSFKTESDWQKQAKDRAMEFLGDSRGKWLCALGAVGSGKTHLCTAICGELLKSGREVRYMLWRDMSVRLKALVNYAEDYAEIVEDFKRVDVLYIDDFFKSRKDAEPSDADIKLAHELLNSRYADRNLTTIVSSERTLNEIMNVDESIGSRIFERGKDYMLEFSGAGKNWRLR